ncbi:MAG TPA: RodZ domain-containing protein [Gaiellaceae bacterium]|nr:RodZ domain-containing protein [Gaiellaceae bacterium]
MFEIGPSLREARARRGLSAEDVQKAIRIRDRYLHALEEERWELLPGDAYVKGFLRTYAEFLGLDGNLYVDEYNGRYAHHEDQALVPEAMAPAESARIGLLRPLVAIGAIVAVVAAVAAWQLHRSPATPSSQRTPPSTPASQPAAKHRKPSTPATHHKPTSKQPRAHVAVASSAVLIATRGRVWLQARSGSSRGALLYEGVLEQGKTLPLKLSPKVWLRIGAPWNLDVKIGGKLAAGLPAQPGNVLVTGSGLSPAA